MDRINKSSNTKKITAHILVWVIILSINLFFFANVYGHQSSLYELYISLNIFTWITYLVVFYTNYLILIPKLMNRGKIAMYIICSVFLVVSCFRINYMVRESDMHRNKANNMPRVIHSREDLYKNVAEGKHLERIAEAINKAGISKSVSDSVVHSITNMYVDMHYDVRSDNNQARPQQRRNEIKTPYPYKGREYRHFTMFYVILLIYLSALILGYVDKTRQRREDLEQMEREKITSELSFLKQQINPHFLFNALNSIYSLVLPHSDNASDAVLKLASMLRYMLYETDKDEVSLDKEIDIARDYIAMQQLKFNDTTKITLEVNGDLLGHTIEPLLIIPFLENAFKYGADNVTPSYISTIININDGYFDLYLTNKIVVRRDNGESSGIGIVNVRRRLDLLYQNNYSLSTKEEQGEYSVKLRLKLH